MRPEHAPTGDPCAKCGIASARHRSRKRARGAYFAGYNAKASRRAARSEGTRLIVGIDGEGYTLASGEHRYTYLAASSEAGLVSELYRPKGVQAEEVFGWLMSLPAEALLVGFSLGYDKTKWVESWPDERIWRLWRPEERTGKNGPLPIDCEGYRVNLVSTRFTVARQGEHGTRTVWDLWKFFQSSFVKALTGWEVGTAAEREHVAKEKERRGNFTRIGKRERAYCQLECRLLAGLARKLLVAHEDEGLKLPSYYGPGSTASLILRQTKADEQNADYPEAMRLPVLAAFFAGRFEPSRVGPVRARRLYSWDIASAYPWAYTRLGCMAKGHGHWRYEREPDPRELPDVAALVHWHLPPHKDACEAWGPLPFRLPDGNIVFPTVAEGGWAWAPEIKAGLALHPGIVCRGAWVWDGECSCDPPFEQKTRELYARRLAWGKAVRGRVLRLGLNSMYGKSCQRVGKGRFRCMVRAGLITSMTRARLVDAIALAKDPWSVLEVATDSVLCTEDLGIASKVPKALGGWDPKPWKGGAFVVRSGLRFALTKDADVDLTAARGVGTRVLHANRALVMRSWEREPMAPVTLETPSFFHGAKLSVRTGFGPLTEEGREAVWTRDPLYGRWTSERRTLTYSPGPKRDALLEGFRLRPWALPLGKGCESTPYTIAGRSKIGQDLDTMRDVEDDQGDVGGLALL